jgi:hypothetical protein
VRIRVLAVVIGLVVSACAEQPKIYGSHSYQCCVEIGPNTTWHAGENVALRWQPTPPGRTTDANPKPIVLSVSLTGPFASVDALKQATSQSLKPAAVRTINAAPLSVNDRVVVSAISQLDLPADLPSGYYNLATSASYAAVPSQSWGGSAVVLISQ